MSNVFLDSDILLDIALDRQPFVISSWEFFERNRKESVFYVSWHSIANIYYIISKIKNVVEAKNYIKNMLQYVEVVICGKHDLKEALELEMADFEDAMQAVAAQAASCEVIVTRNMKDFINSPIPATLPANYKL